MKKGNEEILHRLNKVIYEALLDHDGTELGFLNLNWQHLEVSGSDRKELMITTKTSINVD